MNRLFFGNTAAVAAIAISLLLAGCVDEKTDTAINTAAVVRPAVIQTIAGSAIGNMSFNGVIRSAERAELAFRVPGKLTAMKVNEGDPVEKGQVLATLVQEEFRTEVSSATVEYDKAQTDYNRGAQIFKSTQAISQSDLEKLKAKRDLARNKLANAQQDLSNTSLRAPFAGVIAQKAVNNFLNVKSGQVIYILHDLNNLEVVVNIPGQRFLNPPAQKNAYVTIENDREVKLPVVYKNHSSDADSLSQTYRVVLALTDLKGKNVLPGMNARLYSIDDSTLETVAIQVPIQALVPDNTGDVFVWLVGDEGSVEKRVVQVGQILDDRVIIEDGLAIGDRIVIAGVNALTAGMKVRSLSPKGQQ